MCISLSCTQIERKQERNEKREKVGSNMGNKSKNDFHSIALVHMYNCIRHTVYIVQLNGSLLAFYSLKDDICIIVYPVCIMPFRRFHFHMPLRIIQEYNFIS